MGGGEGGGEGGGGGGYKKGVVWGGGHVKFYPLEKEGAENVLAMLKRGTTSFGIVFMQ